MALRLVSQIHEKDKDMFAPLFKTAPMFTMEEEQDLFGLLGGSSGTGILMREWRWIPREEALSCKVIGYSPPGDGKSLMLHNEQKRINSLLVGIECSAPMKEDLWGNSHTPDAKPKEISAFGKRKWRDYRKVSFNCCRRFARSSN